MTEKNETTGVALLATYIADAVICDLRVRPLRNGMGAAANISAYIKSAVNKSAHAVQLALLADNLNKAKKGKEILEDIKKNLRNEIKLQIKNNYRRVLRRIDELEEVAKTKETLMKYEVRVSDVLVKHPPPPSVVATLFGERVPAESGIYFVWRNGVICYVGQSVNMNARCRSRNHHIIKEGDALSFISCEIKDLNFMESLYIGVVRPELNFGGRKYSAQSRIAA